MRKIFNNFIFLLTFSFLMPLSALATTSTINSNFNGTSIPAGDTVWFSANIHLTGSLPSTPVNIYMVDGKISSALFNITVPNGQVFFNPSAASASTLFNGGQWLTTATAPNPTNTFMEGVAFSVPVSGLPGGINPVTWTANFTTDTPGINLSWQWAAAVYTNGANFSNLNNIGVWPTNSGGLQPGTPTNETSFVTGGARGGGGSNYTGSFSATAAVVPDLPVPEPGTYFILGTMLMSILLFAKRREHRAMIVAGRSSNWQEV